MPDYYPKEEITHECEVISTITKGTISIRYGSIMMFGHLGREEKLYIPLYHNPFTYGKKSDALAAIHSNGNRIMLKTKYDTPSKDYFSGRENDHHDRILELHNILKHKYEEITNTVFDGQDITSERCDIYVDDELPKTVNNGMIRIFDIEVKVDDSLVKKSDFTIKFGDREIISNKISSIHYNIIARNIIHMLSN